MLEIRPIVHRSQNVCFTFPGFWFSRISSPAFCLVHLPFIDRQFDAQYRLNFKIFNELVIPRSKYLSHSLSFSPKFTFFCVYCFIRLLPIYLTVYFSFLSFFFSYHIEWVSRLSSILGNKIQVFRFLRQISIVFHRCVDEYIDALLLFRGRQLLLPKPLDDCSGTPVEIRLIGRQMKFTSRKCSSPVSSIIKFPFTTLKTLRICTYIYTWQQWCWVNSREISGGEISESIDFQNQGCCIY